MVDDNNNNRDIFIAEPRYTTSACFLASVSLYTWTDGRIACWHENEINKFRLTGRREFFLSVQTVSVRIVGRPDHRGIERRGGCACARTYPILNVPGTRSLVCDVIYTVAGPRISPLINWSEIVIIIILYYIIL